MTKTTTPRLTYTKNDKGEFVCPHEGCGKVTARQNTMFYHLKKHAADLSYVCTVCSKGFIQKSGLQQHMAQIHADVVAINDENPYANQAWGCPCCDHTSKMKANMVIHIARKHGGTWVKPASDICTGCKKTFASATAYYYHALECFKSEAPTEITNWMSVPA